MADGDCDSDFTFVIQYLYFNCNSQCMVAGVREKYTGWYEEMTKDINIKRET